MNSFGLQRTSRRIVKLIIIEDVQDKNLVKIIVIYKT